MMLKKIIIATLLICSLSLTAFAQPYGHRNEPPRNNYNQRHAKYSINISSNNGGYVSPRGHITVNRGRTVHLSIRPHRGFIVKRVIIDGRNVGRVHNYVFRNVHRHHRAYVEFTRYNHGHYHRH